MSLNSQIESEYKKLFALQMELKETLEEPDYWEAHYIMKEIDDLQENIRRLERQEGKSKVATDQTDVRDR